MIGDAELDKALLTLKFIWFAMLFSLAVYLFVALQVGATIQVAMEEDVFDKLRFALYALALLTPFVIVYIRRAILAAKGGATGKNQAFQHPLLQKYASAVIVSLALAETAGIYGFILFLVGKNPGDLYLLLLLSAATMVYYRPQREELLALAEEEQTQAAINGGTV